MSGVRIAAVQTDDSGAVRDAPVAIPDSFADLGDQDLTLVASGEHSGQVATANFHLAAA
jgi:hypothetical protein